LSCGDVNLVELSFHRKCDRVCVREAPFGHVWLRLFRLSFSVRGIFLPADEDNHCSTVLSVRRGVVQLKSTTLWSNGSKRKTFVTNN